MLDVQDMRAPMRLSSGSCMVCGGRMQLIAITPRAAPIKELRSFQCVDCDEAMTVEVPLSAAGELDAETG